MREAFKNRNQAFEAHCTTASDLRERPKDDNTYHICDIAKISEHPVLSKIHWHCITAILSVCYLPNVARTLSTLYKMLPLGGILIVKPSSLVGIDVKELIQFLNSQGQAIVHISRQDGNENFEFGSLIIQRTQENLNFPILYDVPLLTEQGDAIFVPDPRYLDCKVDQRERAEKIKKHYSSKRFRDYDLNKAPFILTPGPENPLTKLFFASLEKPLKS